MDEDNKLIDSKIIAKYSINLHGFFKLSRLNTFAHCPEILKHVA
jgi:hypothetical protein